MQHLTRWILSILLTLTCWSSYAQVTAGFNTSPTSGCAPLVVSFTNTTSPASGTTYVWDMDNGTGPITLRDPSTSYFASGTYTVTLTATNGSFSNIARKVITVNPSPVVSFSASDTVGCPGTTVTFSNSSTAGVSGPVAYLWSSGDGYTSTATGYTHQYFLPGYFNVSLKVTNAAGCATVLTKPSHIHIWPPPVPSFATTTRRVCPGSGPVGFTSSVAGVAPFSYKWSFGDGSTSTLANPGHAYITPGAYTVKLAVTDGRGCTDSVVFLNYIRMSPLNAAFTAPDSACVYNNVAFTNTSTGHLSSLWIYGDGASGTALNGNHIYNVRDTYFVKLIVADSFCTDTFMKRLIIPDPDISFKITPDSPCPAPVLATFKAKVPGGSTVIWDYGDSTVGAGISSSHTYYKNGMFVVNLIVVNGIGCRDSVVDTYTVYKFEYRLRYPPFTNKGGCIPYSQKFELVKEGGYPYQRVLFIWDYGDGSPLDSTYNDSYAPTHVYTTIGKHAMSVKMLSEPTGCFAYLRDTIITDTPSRATFIATPTHQCFNHNLIKFTRTLSLGPDLKDISYYWLWGDGIYGYRYYDTGRVLVRDVLYHFQLPGLFSDTLLTMTNYCFDTFILKDHILIDSPMAKATARVICSLHNTAEFKNISLGDDSHIWYFADGTTSALDSVVHTFPASSIYENMLTVYNVRSGCRDTIKVTVDLRRAIASISVSDSTICKGDSVTLFASRLSGDIVTYKWETPGGVLGAFFANPLDPRFTEKYLNPGRYTVKLYTFDQNFCPDTFVKTNYILVAKPNVNFRVTPPVACWPQPLSYIDSSTDQPGVSFANFRWSFGDSVTLSSGVPAVTHMYSAPGVYSIKEVVTDNVGCKDSIIKSIGIYRPKAAFAAANQTCANVNVYFTNISAAATSYLWQFGDGATSSLTNPVHVYRDSGTFIVRLIATESHGCMDTASWSIKVSKPYASFYMDDSVSVCPPLAAHFHNTSFGGVSNFWVLGDGNTSIATHPSNLYTLPGYDTVRLIVTNAAGCRDTAIGHVKVYGYAGAFSYNADSGCVPLTIHFNADLSNIALAASIIWDYSDGIVGSSSLSDTSSHAYAVPGAYLPKLIITDHAGCVSSSLGKDTIKADKVNAGFLAIPDPVCLNDTIRMTDTSHGYWARINKWHWDHNGDTSDLQSPYFVFSGVGSHTVSLTATDAWGCSGSAYQVVSVYSLPGITSLPDSAICVGNTTDLDNGIPGGTWSSGNTLIAIVGSATGIVAGLTSGIAVITYSLSEVCYVTMPVTVNAYPFAGYITGDTTLCIGDTVLLSDTVAGGVWRVDGNSVIIDAAGRMKGILSGSDTVYYIVANAACEDTAIKLVVVFPSPDSGIISGKHIICIDAVTTLTETVAGGIWKSADSAIIKVDTVTGKIIGISLGNTVVSYSIKDINGCISRATFPVRVADADFNIIAVVENVKCYGGADGSIAVTIEGGAPPFEYRWSVDSTTPGISGLDTGMYAIDVRSLDNQCRLHKEYEVKQPDSIAINPLAENDICYRAKGSVGTNVAGGVGPYSYMWSNNGNTPEIKGLIAGMYSLKVTDANGCFKVYYVMIADSCADILIRTGVSPNGDGANDTWIIEGIEKFPQNNVKLFDKWGDKIYEKDGYNNEWFGEGPNGSLLPDGTYYYLVKLNSEYNASGKDVYTGYVLLKR